MGLGAKVQNVQNGVDGGHGNDNLTGGPGGGVLIGGDGKHTITGGPTGNILVGGLGADTLNAGAFGDILIGGTTDYDPSSDLHHAALQSLLAEWRTNTSVRFTHIALGAFNGPGLNGNNLLNAVDVHDDTSVDKLNGGRGIDWIFRHLGGIDIINPGTKDMTYNL